MRSTWLEKLSQLRLLCSQWKVEELKMDNYVKHTTHFLWATKLLHILKYIQFISKDLEVFSKSNIIFNLIIDTTRNKFGNECTWCVKILTELKDNQFILNWDNFSGIEFMSQKKKKNSWAILEMH